ncbi:MAG TPA: hypothetical protein VGQ76_18845 [Thermoanaerobaculia bacterium]|jgi:hypothetical protein|nr:hypothetical protein [Thermoanaerobaculia bacterium]
MRRAFLLIVLLTATTAVLAQERRGNGDWVPSNQKGCIGGSSCPERRLRVELQDKPVLAVRFRAHDQIGTKADGALRVKIDGNTVNGHIDIPRKGEVFTIDVEELTGRYLVLEAASDDEVEISDIAILYSRDRQRVPPRDRDWDRPTPRPSQPSGGDWRTYPRSGGCIGGDECRKNGKRITIALEEAAVLGIRFYAKDDIGQRADGKLSVSIDDTQVGFRIDVQRAGKRHELDVDNLFGRKLIIEAASDDEVDVSDIQVLYGRRGRPGGGSGSGSTGGGWGGRREITHEGGCIGGSECGGKRSQIRIRLDGRPVESLRFYARDDIGTKAGGELRIRIDDEVIEYALDIPREGKTFTIDGNNIAGDYLIFEPAEDDEVAIKDVRVLFQQGDSH